MEAAGKNCKENDTEILYSDKRSPFFAFRDSGYGGGYGGGGGGGGYDRGYDDRG